MCKNECKSINYFTKTLKNRNFEVMKCFDNSFVPLSLKENVFYDKVFFWIVS